MPKPFDRRIFVRTEAMSPATVHIGVLVGSIRKASVNAQLATVMGHLAPTDFVFHRIRINDLPHYNADLESPSVAAVNRLREEVRACDALLFVTPEYNRSIPGVLKNALDWRSRPHNADAFVDKPAGVIGATPCALGTANAQLHLRNILACLAVATMRHPMPSCRHARSSSQMVELPIPARRIFSGTGSQVTSNGSGRSSSVQTADNRRR